jgi:hypothetical protein
MVDWFEMIVDMQRGSGGQPRVFEQEMRRQTTALGMCGWGESRILGECMQTQKIDDGDSSIGATENRMAGAPIKPWTQRQPRITKAAEPWGLPMKVQQTPAQHNDANNKPCSQKTKRV